MQKSDIKWVNLPNNFKRTISHLQHSFKKKIQTNIIYTTFSMVKIQKLKKLIENNVLAIFIPNIKNYKMKTNLF